MRQIRFGRRSNRGKKDCIYLPSSGSVTPAFRLLALQNHCIPFLPLLSSTMLRSSLLKTVRRAGRRTYHASVLPSLVSRSSPEFQEKARSMDTLVEDLESKLAAARQGGGPKAAARMKGKGKLLPRERYGRLHAVTAYMQCKTYRCTNRLALLLDPHSPFVELSALAAHEVYSEPIPGAGMITGIGRIAGRECVIVVNDATVKGGSYHPLTVKKHLRAQEIARENNLPCVYVGEFIQMLGRPCSQRLRSGIWWRRATSPSECTEVPCTEVYNN